MKVKAESLSLHSYGPEKRKREGAERKDEVKFSHKRVRNKIQAQCELEF